MKPGSWGYEMIVNLTATTLTTEHVFGGELVQKHVAKNWWQANPNALAAKQKRGEPLGTSKAHRTRRRAAIDTGFD